MYKQFDDQVTAFDWGHNMARSGDVQPLVALEQIGTRRSYGRDDEIYAEGDEADCWFQVIAGAVRLTKLLPDGRRHIAEFCFAGDCFGLNDRVTRGLAAEVVGNAIVMRFPRAATTRLIESNPKLAQQLCTVMLHELTHAQTRMLLLGRMTAAERVASFLLELADRRAAERVLNLPMSRNDIADYLGLTIETVCRVLTSFKREGFIAVPTPQRIELTDRSALATLCEA